MSKPIRPYYITRKNTIIQVVFTTFFAYLFINLYKPLNAGEWDDVSFWVFSLATGIIVVCGMLVVLASRLLMFWRKRKRSISILYYLSMIAAEIFFMALWYVFLQRWVLKNEPHPFPTHLYFSIQNTALILLIPYLISTLFFEWQEKKMSLEKLIKQISRKAYFIPFNDEKGRLKLTLKTSDLIFLQAADNYVVIHYESIGKTKTYLIRNRLKQFEKDLTEFPVVRCHRSYMVNINHVKLLKREKGVVQLIMDNEGQNLIPVSKTFENNVSQMLSTSIVQE
ncbi:MAG: LytTR family transcriptional regulator DNA-binding domain-containing protein [Prevotellaceae bacterium]|jgi:hypothetical protein|nr:LytTR family transcriptional regulator DNA-binding domain-containing protein [Prevotellaceae bacterium]